MSPACGARSSARCSDADASSRRPAVTAAAALFGKTDINGRRVGIILSGGNVDLGKFFDPR